MGEPRIESLANPLVKSLRALFDHLLARARDVHGDVASGVFGADMQVHLVHETGHAHLLL